MRRPDVKWIKRGICLFLSGGILLGGLFISEFFFGPRMQVQPYYLPFETEMPMPPEGIVPIEIWPSLPPENPMTEATPPETTEENLKRGRIYYHYYCLFCHGVTGDGNGPVGQSYMPAPTNLHSDKVQQAGDLELLRAMLTGRGHEPVLERVVPPDHRWHLVLYLRHLETRLEDNKSASN